MNIEQEKQKLLVGKGLLEKIELITRKSVEIGILAQGEEDKLNRIAGREGNNNYEISLTEVMPVEVITAQKIYLGKLRDYYSYLLTENQKEYEGLFE